MVAAARSAPGQQAMVGFTYRRTPAVALAQAMVADGAIGTVRQVRAQYLQDWLADENSPLTWRLDKELAGSGALGDIGAHIVDAVEFVTGQRLSGVSGLLETFVKERPLPGAASGGGASSIGGSAGRGLRAGHRRRRGAVLRSPGVRCDRIVRGEPVRARPEERLPLRDQRHARAVSPSTSRT